MEFANVNYAKQPNKKLTKNNMVSYIKQKLNRNFYDMVEYQTEFHNGGGYDDNTEKNILWDNHYTMCAFFQDTLKFAGAMWADEWTEKYDNTLNLTLIKKIERDTILEVVVLPLQKKIKEMLYNPNTRRGKAFALKNIEWAFE